MDKLDLLMGMSLLLAFTFGIFFSYVAPANSIVLIYIEYFIFFLFSIAIFGGLILRKFLPNLTAFLIDYYGYGLMFLSAGIFFVPVLNVAGLAFSLIYVSLVVFLSGVMLILYRDNWKAHLNLFTLFTSAMFATYIGSVTGVPLMIEIFMGLCVYDIMAVFRTKLMATLVSKVLHSKTIPPMFLTDMDLPTVIAKLDNNLPKNVEIKGHFIGNGDVIMASAFAISVGMGMNVTYGLLLLVAGFIGIKLNFAISNARKVGLPALPLIFITELMALVALNHPTLVTCMYCIGGIAAGYYFIDGMAIGAAKRKEKLLAEQAAKNAA